MLKNDVLLSALRLITILQIIIVTLRKLLIFIGQQSLFHASADHYNNLLHSISSVLVRYFMNCIISYT